MLPASVGVQYQDLKWTMESQRMTIWR